MLLYTHTACLAHDPGPGHPECPARLEAVLHAVRAAFPALEWRQAPEATRDALLRVHTRSLVESVLDTVVDGQHRLDEDTMLSPGSAQAALRAAGAGIAAVDAVMAGEGPQAFCAVRPPGHHATRDVAMGFCLFNSVAVAAAHAVHAHGLHRVAIADFDVHHGNGSQDIFAGDPRVMYLSSHQSPLYPNTGDPAERGVGNLANAGDVALGHYIAHPYNIEAAGEEGAKFAEDYKAKTGHYPSYTEPQTVIGITFLGELKKNPRMKFTPVIMLTTEDENAKMQQAKATAEP